MARIGRYELLEVLGRGSTGTVYAARAQGGPVVALKVLNDTDLELMERLRREAAILARLDGQPNILRCHDVGEERGRPYLVSDLVKGGTLHDALRTGQLAGVEACRAIVKIARALHAAHEAGVVHRDVKPSNILLGEDGTPFLADFGFAKDTRSQSLTQSGVSFGTFAFMAPEQVEARSVDRRADVYALGGIIYYVFAGRPPYTGSATSVLQKIAAGAPPLLRTLKADVDPRIEAVCARALARSPGDRFATAAELADALEAALVPRAAPPRAVLRGVAVALLVAGAAVAGRFSARGSLLPFANTSVEGTDALFEAAFLSLRAGLPVATERLAALDQLAAVAAVGTAKDALPFLHARSDLLRGDVASAGSAIAQLAKGNARSLLEAELAATQHDWPKAAAALDGAPPGSVPWSEPDAAKRWEGLARASAEESRATAALAWARAATLVARARPGATEEIAALADRAFASDARTACLHMDGVLLAVTRSATELLSADPPDPAGVRLARRRLLLVRLARPDAELGEPLAHLMKLAISPDPRVREAARPWNRLLPPNQQDEKLETFLLRVKGEQDFRPIKVHFMVGAVRLQASTIYEAYADLIVLRREFATLWLGFTRMAITADRLSEARRALDIEDGKPAFKQRREQLLAAVEAIEKGMPADAHLALDDDERPGPGGPPGPRRALMPAGANEPPPPPPVGPEAEPWVRSVKVLMDHDLIEQASHMAEEHLEEDEWESLLKHPFWGPLFRKLRR